MKSVAKDSTGIFDLLYRTSKFLDDECPSISDKTGRTPCKIISYPSIKQLGGYPPFGRATKIRLIDTILHKYLSPGKICMGGIISPDAEMATRLVTAHSCLHLRCKHSLNSSKQQHDQILGKVENRPHQHSIFAVVYIYFTKISIIPSL